MADSSFLDKIPSEVDIVRRILLERREISSTEVDEALYQARDKALAVRPYGSIKSFYFLNLLPTTQDPQYQAVAARLKAPGSTETFLDVGCCVGHVVRHLEYENVSSERLFGTDLLQGFLDVGHDLFGDRNTSRATYIAGDMLDENDARLDQLKGKIDIIYASAFFHLFEREGQAKAAKRMVQFLNLDNPDVMIFGLNEGPKIQGWEKYQLDKDSWEQLWGEVGDAMGVRWKTDLNVESSEEWNKVRFRVYRERE